MLHTPSTWSILRAQTVCMRIGIWAKNSHAGKILAGWVEPDLEPNARRGALGTIAVVETRADQVVGPEFEDPPKVVSCHHNRLPVNLQVKERFPLLLCGRLKRPVEADTERISVSNEPFGDHDFREASRSCGIG